MQQISIFISTFILLLLSIESFSQVNIANVNVTTKDVPNPDNSPLLQDSLGINITFDVSAINQVKVINLKYGTGKGQGDYLDVDIIYVLHKGQDVINYKNSYYPVIGGKVQIYDVIPKSSLNKPNFLVLSGKDKGNKDIKRVEVQVR